MSNTDNETAPITMNERLRLKPPKRDVFAKYHVEDTEQNPGTTEPKEANE